MFYKVTRKLTTVFFAYLNRERSDWEWVIVIVCDEILHELSVTMRECLSEFPFGLVRVKQHSGDLVEKNSEVIKHGQSVRFNPEYQTTIIGGHHGATSSTKDHHPTEKTTWFSSPGVIRLAESNILPASGAWVSSLASRASCHDERFLPSEKFLSCACRAEVLRKLTWKSILESSIWIRILVLILSISSTEPMLSNRV